MMSPARENKTRYSILGMLSFSPKSGYEISQSIQQSTAFFWAESEGQLYPLLKRMTEEGLITVTEENESGKRSRKVYELTGDGEATLIDWLHREPTTFNTRNEFLLQLFFGHNLSTEDNLEKINDFKYKLRQKLKLYDSIEQRVKQNSKYPTYLLLSLSYGQHGLNSEIAWCDEVIKMLKKKIKEENKHG